MTKALTVKINPTSVEIVESLIKYYSDTINLNVSKAQLIEMALRDLQEKVL